MEDHTQTPQLCTGVTAGAFRGVYPHCNRVNVCVCVCVSHVFADVQLHQLRHAAERVAPGDGGDHPSDRLQAETGHTSHGQRGHW